MNFKNINKPTLLNLTKLDYSIMLEVRKTLEEHGPCSMQELCKLTNRQSWELLKLLRLRKFLNINPEIKIVFFKNKKIIFLNDIKNKLLAYNKYVTEYCSYSTSITKNIKKLFLGNDYKKLLQDNSTSLRRL